MIGTYGMKELTTFNKKFTQSEEKDDKNFSRSRNFCLHMYTFQYLWASQMVWKATLAN